MTKLRSYAAFLLAVFICAACFTQPVSAEFDKNKLSAGVYQLNVIHSVTVPELDDAAFTVWLSALCFSVGTSADGTGYVMTDAGMEGPDRLYDTLGDKFVEFLTENGISATADDLAEHIELTYTAYYAVYEGAHVELTPVEQSVSRDVLLFTSATPLPASGFDYAYADEAVAESAVHTFALSGADVDGVVKSTEDAYITNWSLNAVEGKIKLPAEVQDGRAACTYSDIPASRSTQGSPLFDENGSFIGMNVWVSAYEGTVSVTSAAVMGILDGVGVSYNIAQAASNALKTTDILIYIYIAAVVVVILVAVLVILRMRRKKYEREDAAELEEEARQGRADFEPKPGVRPAYPPRPAAPRSAEAAVPAGTPRVVTLSVLGGSLQGFTKTLDEPLTLGRDPEKCSVVFPVDETAISRVHCTVSYNKQTGRILLEDLNSSNGTYFPSGSRIIPGRLYALRSGDRFYLGLAENTVEVRMS